MSTAAKTEKWAATTLPRSDRYEFQDRIGGGGIGTVYRGLDRQTDRAVAIKVLKVKYSENETLHRRLAREFKAASELEHPNIVHALDLQTDGEISYVVFELVEGKSLGDRISREGRLEESEAVRIITQVAQALDYAHQRKVVHRDVKPDNILLLPDGRAMLTDFGLAKDYGDEQDEDLTRNASGMGTPNYMAPEQFVNAKTAGVLSDVYSLAATLYHTLTGTMPFTGKTPLAILNKKLKGDYKPVRAVVETASARVEAAVAAGLQPEPEKRPQSCLAFFKLLTAREKVRTGPLRQVKQSAVVTLTAKGQNRRTSVRFPLHVGTSGKVDADALGETDPPETWPLVVHDVSVGGVGILLARRFEPNTVLSIELAVSGSEPPKRFKCKVVRVQAESAGHWVHGCTFLNPMSKDDVNNLLNYA